MLKGIENCVDSLSHFYETGDIWETMEAPRGDNSWVSRTVPDTTRSFACQSLAFGLTDLSYIPIQDS